MDPYLVWRHVYRIKIAQKELPRERKRKKLFEEESLEEDKINQENESVNCTDK